ncbi:glycoside hydrolase [Schizophyllum amplum]|uniref:lytic cellulose monooxygenase (C4-dehydrogenating) n=1 Tax=Schizophyllum amplum TaxID=97359 RepID=A0A550C141_9AGAR|nr:glycoside hydrolase [Auriculariopsis ampla]
MRNSHSFLAGLAVALLPYVAAHGYVSSITIDGKKYDGPYIEESGSFPIRGIKSIDPVMGTDSKDIRCGPGSKAASKHADARPGSELEVKWSGGGGQKWPHNAGPMLTYLARCADDDCTKFDAADARWFKIDEVGLRKDGKTWVQEDLMKGKPAKLTLPDTLAPGAYLLRHEVIALHEANKKGGAQFYPSCAQIKVSGEETGEPAEDELVDFPGAYKDTDKGILVNPWEVTLKSYVFPGRPLRPLSRVARRTRACRRRPAQWHVGVP